MAKHIEKGKLGENIALEYLIKNDYKILETNWRSGKAEIDIIAMDGDVLVFFEVKSRSTDFFGMPENAVNTKKEKLLVAAATSYMYEISYDWKIRFDIISIILRSANDFEFHHFRDAFFPGL
jgi:putative endonuclease